MTREFNGKLIPTEILSKTLVGTTPNGETKDLIKIDEVDRFDKAGSTAPYIRLILNNELEDVQDSFYFSQNEDMELRDAFIQTTEANMKLMEWEMMLIQEQADLNHFVIIICREYFQKYLGFANFNVE